MCCAQSLAKGKRPFLLRQYHRPYVDFGLQHFQPHFCLHSWQMDEQSNKSRNSSTLREGCEGAILSIHEDDAALFGHTAVVNVISATSLLGSLYFPKEKKRTSQKTNLGALSLAQCRRHWCDSDPGECIHFPATYLPPAQKSGGDSFRASVFQLEWKPHQN